MHMEMEFARLFGISRQEATEFEEWMDTISFDEMNEKDIESLAALAELELA